MIAATRETGLYEINEITLSHKRVNSTVIAYLFHFRQLRQQCAQMQL